MVPAVLVASSPPRSAPGSAPLLGLAANFMFFTVGWHYAKQGYGILMLDAALKGVRLRSGERRRLLWNTHLTWVTNWLLVNDALGKEELWGLTYYFFDTPDPLLFAMVGLVAVSTFAVGRDLFGRWRAERVLPFNGLVAYVAAVYVWLTIGRLDPILLLVVPMFHSLQYSVVVYRYQLNVEGAREGRASGDEALPAWLCSAPAMLVTLHRRGHGPRLRGLLARSGPVRRLPETTTRRWSDPRDRPVHCVDVHQHPPLLPRQRDVAAREPRDPPAPVRGGGAMSASSMAVATAGGVPAGGAPSRACRVPGGPLRPDAPRAGATCTAAGSTSSPSAAAACS